MVATQVVEVSLDVDFEQGFFEVAPIDAIIQRMGRINRSGNRSPVTSKFSQNNSINSIYIANVKETSMTNVVKSLKQLTNCRICQIL